MQPTNVNVGIRHVTSHKNILKKDTLRIISSSSWGLKMTSLFGGVLPSQHRKRT